MAKRKRKPRKTNKQPPPDDLGQVQANHLDFLEQWAGGLPGVNGVPVVKALNYELIQIINKVHLTGGEAQ